jgi:hypothetical protein
MEGFFRLVLLFLLFFCFLHVSAPGAGAERRSGGIGRSPNQLATAERR